ncbi:hypothetical protein K438DRAFT_2017495 [Mycena galopus ATCC 62051]|nr:hypothetical protein K438DRAFT_2017495 [Mycena galopus ATCC 62051]
MPSLDQVPDELWLEILAQVPLETLKHVSLTQRHLSRLSRHLIFTDFHFHPYATSGLILLLPNVLKVKRALERLNFWTTDVAHLVHSCEITPWSANSTQARSHTETPYILLAPFFERLGRFTSLRHIYAHQVLFTQIALTNLCSLPALTQLHIHECGVAPEAHMDLSSLNLELRVSRFQFTRLSSQDDGITLWMPLLRPDHLRELEVQCNFRFLDLVLPAIAPFHRVYKLSLTLDASKVAHNLTLLAKFPALEVLSLTGPWTSENLGEERPRADQILPMLREYKGYFGTLPIYLALPTLTRLEVFEPFRSATPRDFMRQLQGLSPTQITMLTVRFTWFEHAALAPLSDFFPRLISLRITIRVEDVQLSPDGINRQATAFFSALAYRPIVPRTLEHLSISWEFTSVDYDETRASHPRTDDLPDLTGLGMALMAGCPALTFLWLDGHDFMLHWRTSPSGTVELNIALNIQEAIALRTRLSASSDVL